ncbi:magnesium transporter NIPA-domain-containing protein [Lipomyces japonicus]|uniref:magnesium transporter NIPA-domain-containing protein n=1 Tax=Lipomyces japonicus TaxID=56871 RepID=UPI0034CF6F2F
MITAYDNLDDDIPSQHSSSLVGIITAIVGNIIISIALNLQRYAHLKLKREQQADQQLAGNYNSIASENVDRIYDADDDDYAESGEVLTTDGEARINQLSSQRDYFSEVAGRSEALESFKNLPSTLESPSYDSSSVSGSVNSSDVRLTKTSETGTQWQNGRNSSKQTRKGRKFKRKRVVQRSDTAHSIAGSATSTTTENADKLPKYMKSSYWWLGIALMIAGETGNFLAYGFAPASIVSPLGVIALISNCIVAPIFFHEEFRLRDFFGVLIAIAGAVTVVLSSNATEEVLDPRLILLAISQLSFQIYVGITIVCMTVLSICSNRFGDRLIFIDISLVALFGGYTALSTKAVSSFITYSLSRAFTYPITYILVLILILSAILQVKYLTRALQRFSSTQVIPTHFVFFTLSVIIGSAILYQDFDGATNQQLTRFFIGCGLTFVGVYLITSKRAVDEVSNTSAPAKDAAVNDDEFFSTVASVNLDRSSGARTPTSFYDEDEDAHEINDPSAVEARVNAFSYAINRALPHTSETAALLSLNPSLMYSSSPGTSSRSYVPGTAGVGLIVDSVVRDRMKSWHRQQQRQGGRNRRRIIAEPAVIDSRSAPLYRSRTGGGESTDGREE